MAPLTRRDELHDRYVWLDQARGVIVLMLIISIITDKYSGDVMMGERPIGPPMLNHGYDYFTATPVMITFIDLGQSLFMFMMGFVGYGAFTSRLQKRGKRAALLYAVRRVGVLYALAFFGSIVVKSLAGEPNWNDFFYNSTFTMLALGSFAMFVSVALCPDADRRMVVCVALALLHSLLYAYPIFHHHAGTDYLPGQPRFPFGIMGTCAVAIAGTSFGQWYQRDPDNSVAGFQTRIVPAAIAALVAAYCMDWVQPAQHHDVTAALQFLAIAIGGFTLMMFYAFGTVGFHFPLLTSMGKNLLALFVFSGIFIQAYLEFIPKSFLLQWPDLALPLVGIVPIIIVAWFARLLERRGIMVRA